MVHNDFEKAMNIISALIISHLNEAGHFRWSLLALGVPPSQSYLFNVIKLQYIIIPKRLVITDLVAFRFNSH